MVQGNVVIPHNHLDMEQHQGVKDTLECGEIAHLGVNVGNILQGFSRHNIGMDKAFPDQAQQFQAVFVEHGRSLKAGQVLGVHGFDLQTECHVKEDHSTLERIRFIGHLRFFTGHEKCSAVIILSSVQGDWI